jgi:CheY-like chemotaxis protein
VRRYDKSMNAYAKPKILMIEDNVNNQQLFRDAFESAGFQVLTTGGADGNFVEAVVSFSPDIISMDLMIGKPGWGDSGRDGFDAIELLKGDGMTKDLPIIVMTNFFEDGKVDRAKKLGVIDYINLQGHSISKIPDAFLEYLAEPEAYQPVHPSFRTGITL